MKFDLWEGLFKEWRLFTDKDNFLNDRKNELTKFFCKFKTMIFLHNALIVSLSGLLPQSS